MRAVAQAAGPAAGVKGKAGASAGTAGIRKTLANSAAGTLSPPGSPSGGAAGTVLVRRSARERGSRIAMVSAGRVEMEGCRWGGGVGWCVCACVCGCGGVWGVGGVRRAASQRCRLV